MTNNEVKKVMKNWYEAYKDNGDKSYMQLYDALHMIKIAGLMTSDQWDVISKYDDELFRSDDDGFEQLCGKED